MIEQPLLSLHVDTPLGTMWAMANDDAVCVLVFEEEMRPCYRRMQTKPGSNAVLRSIEQELAAYFSGDLKAFTTPIKTQGTPFQQRTWAALCTIPYGETRAYAEMADQLGQPTAIRAAASANGANPISILVPCHRVIQKDGGLGGYAGGIARKQWLLAHEAMHLPKTPQ